MRKPTQKQNAFLNEYLIDLNSTQSAIRAGYKPKRAKEMGYRLIHNSTLTPILQKKLDEREKKTGISSAFVLNSLKDIAERCMQRQEVLDSTGKPTGVYKFDSNGANRSLELLGKHLKLFTERIETQNLNINSDVTKLTDQEIEDELAELNKGLTQIIGGLKDGK